MFPPLTSPSSRGSAMSQRRIPAARRTPRALATLALATLLSTALLGAGQAEEAGPGRSGTGEEVIWSLTPSADESEGSGQADSRVSFRFEVEPGATVEDSVELTNHSNREITYQLTASDGVIGASGAFDMLPPGVESSRAGTWIEVDEESVTVPSGESVDVPFTLTVPENATPGDHPGGIAASVSPEDAADEQVSTVARVGTRIHLRVAGEIQPVIELRDLEMDYGQNWNPFAPGTLTARWTAENTGNVRLGSDQDLTVAGPFGWFGSTVPATEIRELLPGQTVELEMATEVWPLFVTGAEVSSVPSAVGEDQVEAEPRRTAANSTAPALPIPQLLVLLLVVAVVWWFVARRRRRKAAFDAAVEQAVEKEVAGRTASATSATSTGSTTSADS